MLIGNKMDDDKEKIIQQINNIDLVLEDLKEKLLSSEDLNEKQASFLMKIKKYQESKKSLQDKKSIQKRMTQIVDILFEAGELSEPDEKMHNSLCEIKNKMEHFNS